MTRTQILGFGVAAAFSAGLFALACGSSETGITPLPDAAAPATNTATSTTTTDALMSDAGEIPTCIPDVQVKGAACGSLPDGFVCQKNCGPTNSGGRKTETCKNGVFVEGACGFPAGDYACYKVSELTPECTTVNGGAPVKATALCDLALIGSCKPCAGYQDSAGTAKQGFCHCLQSGAVNDAGALEPPKWTCGSINKEWPCNPDGTPNTASPGVTGCI